MRDTEDDLTREGPKLVACMALFAVLGVAMFAPLSLHPASHLPDDGDSLQGIWILWWSATHLELGYPGILAANGYYPHPDALLYSESQLATALWSSPLFLLLDNRVLAYNILSFVALVASALAAWLLYRRIAGDALAALPGAVLFAFNAYNVSHLPQTQLIQAQWIPLGLLFLHLYARAPTLTRAVAFAVASLLVGLSSFYYLLFYAYAVAVLLPAYLWLERRTVSAGWLLRLAAPSAVAGLVFAAVALPYLTLFDLYGFTGEPENFDIARFLVPPAGSLYRPPGDALDGTYFLGFVTLALALLGALAALRDRGETMRVLWIAYIGIGVSAAILAAGPDLVVAGHWLGDGPFRILQWVPAFENLRAPSRFAVLVYLVIGLLATRGTMALSRALPRRATVLVAALVVVVALEQRTPNHVRGYEIPIAERIPDAYRWLGENPPDGPVIDLPVWPFRRIRYASVDAYFSTFHERPIPLGKPSFYPPALELLQWELRDFPDERSLAILRSLDIDLALVHPKRWEEPQRRAHGERMLRQLADELPIVARFKSETDPLLEHYRLGSETLYLVAGGEIDRSPRECDCTPIDRDTWTLTANGVNAPELAIDGDRLTKWTTGEMQQEGFYFEIAFDEPRRPVRVEVEMAFPYGEFARNLEMNGYVGSRGQRVEQIEDIPYTLELVRTLIEDPKRARLRYDLVPMTLERLRLFIHRTEEATIGWSLPEIHVFESADGNSDVP